MKIFKITDFNRGWVVGDFEPSLIRTKDFEFAVQFHKANKIDPKHVHKLARELTVVVSGKHLLNGQELSAGDIFLIEPGEAAEFICLEDGATAVIKTPSVIGDKYLID